MYCITGQLKDHYSSSTLYINEGDIHNRNCLKLSTKTVHVLFKHLIIYGSICLLQSHTRL